MIVDALYRQTNLPMRYLGNPYIEALPPIVSQAERIRAMTVLPEVDFSYAKALSPEVRRMDVDALEKLYLPCPVADDVAVCVDELFRSGYSRANPLQPQVIAGLYDQAWLAKNWQSRPSLAGMVLLIGPSGQGKSTLIQRVLSRYPSAIRHIAFDGRPFNQTQLVWLSIQTPANAAILGLMLAALQSLDAALGLTATGGSYAKQAKGCNQDVMLDIFATAASTHGLGILHIDDLQKVVGRGVQRRALLEFIMQMANKMPCPVLFSATTRLELAIDDDFETARRITSGGMFRLRRPESETEGFHLILAKTLLKYQWLDVPLGFSDTVNKNLWHLSAGITSAHVLLHRKAQKLALRRGDKQLTWKHFQDAYRADFQLVDPALKILRKGGESALAEYEKLLPANGYKEVSKN